MGNSLMGKIMYFWIFIIGGMVMAKIFGMPMDPKSVIILLVVLSCFYWGLALIRATGKKRREQKKGE
ncbi:MAG: hypothetical protein VB031_05330 [Eubacteriaceae bacterium]|nr:hypothetical protein [Eubacteriaceae bacterium]